MAYPAYIREKAQQLRREKKMTIDELAECLALPRTTIYYWVQDMPIPRSLRQVEAAERGRQLGRERMRRKHRLLREAAYDEAQLQQRSNSNGLKGRKWRSRYGLLTVRASDTQLRAELQAWMDCVQNEWLDSIPSGRSSAW